VALRWRIEKEVIEGKGQFMCGDKRCTESEGLRSWEASSIIILLITRNTVKPILSRPHIQQTPSIKWTPV